jgi:TRAP-type mannitol/chloroaromatic compound transport system permease small subunit
MPHDGPPPGRLADITLTILAWLVVALMLAVAAQVVAARLGVNPLMAFDGALPILGHALTQNSLRDFQWHMLVIVALLPAGLVWLRDGHVRVDFLYARYSDRGRRRVDLAGNLLFALPFLVLAVPAAWAFSARAWRTDEGSANAGLQDLWAIKVVLPLGLALLGVAVALECVRLGRGRPVS